MKGGLGNIMKQAQKMQAEMQKAQEELGTIEITGAAGGGMVKVTMTGKHQVRRVEIEPSLLEDDDKEMLEDLIAAACNDAAQKVEAAVSEHMSGVTSGMPLPPGMKLPF